MTRFSNAVQAMSDATVRASQIVSTAKAELDTVLALAMMELREAAGETSPTPTPQPPSPDPDPTPPGGPPPVVIAGLTVKTINGFVPPNSAVRWFTDNRSGGNIQSHNAHDFGRDDAIVFKFQAPPAGDNYFNLSVAETLRPTLRTFVLSETAGDFGPGLKHVEAMGFNLNLASVGIGVSLPRSTVRLAPGGWYYLNICNRQGGVATVAGVNDIFITMTNP